MGRCAGCRKQTQFFCYVHQAFVCTTCVVTAPLHKWCVIGSYRTWVQDSNYEWPPRCPQCRVDFSQDDPAAADAVIRLPCLHLIHKECLPSLPGATDRAPVCPTCSLPALPKAGDDTELTRILNKAAEVAFPWTLAPSGPPAPPASDLSSNLSKPSTPAANSGLVNGDARLHVDQAPTPAQAPGSALASEKAEPAVISAPARATRALESSATGERSRRVRKMLRKTSLETSRRWRSFRRAAMARKDLLLLFLVVLVVCVMVFFYFDQDSQSPGVRDISKAEHRAVTKIASKYHKLADSERVRAVEENLMSGARQLRHPGRPYGA